MNKLTCLIGLHKFGKWSKPERFIGEFHSYLFGGFGKSIFFSQTRECELCGHVSRRIAE